MCMESDADMVCILTETEAFAAFVCLYDVTKMELEPHPPDLGQGPSSW